MLGALGDKSKAELESLAEDGEMGRSEKDSDDACNLEGFYYVVCASQPTCAGWRPSAPPR